MMDPTHDEIQMNPLVGTWDTVTYTLGIWEVPNFPFKKIPIQSRWLLKPFVTANIHHERTTQTWFVARVTTPLGENGWQWASISGCYPPRCGARVGGAKTLKLLHF